MGRSLTHAPAAVLPSERGELRSLERCPAGERAHESKTPPLVVGIVRSSQGSRDALVWRPRAWLSKIEADLVGIAKLEDDGHGPPG